MNWDLLKNLKLAKIEKTIKICWDRFFTATYEIEFLTKNIPRANPIDLEGWMHAIKVEEC